MCNGYILQTLEVFPQVLYVLIPFDKPQILITSFLDKLDKIPISSFSFVSMISVIRQITTNFPIVFISYVYTSFLANA